MRTELDPSYTAEVDSSSAESWYIHLDRFADANLYQTWDWGLTFSGARRISNLVLKKTGEIVAIAQVRLFPAGPLKGGIAFARWGPLWQPKIGSTDVEVFRQAVRALRIEYVDKRKLALRLLPRLFVGQGTHVTVMQEEGYRQLRGRRASKTLLLDVSQSLEDLRSNFLRKWRGHLNSAEKQNLSVATGQSREFFADFAALHRAMMHRKRFATSTDLEGHQRLQEQLPERYKMSVIIARKDGEPCAGGIFSFHGDTAVYLFGATNEAGMQSSASYLVQWEALKMMKARGLTQYDFHGINAEANPGTYTFKKGAAGKTGVEADFVGQFQALMPSVTNYSILAAEAVRHNIREWL